MANLTWLKLSTASLPAKLAKAVDDLASHEERGVELKRAVRALFYETSKAFPEVDYYVSLPSADKYGKVKRYLSVAKIEGGRKREAGGIDFA
tara:strand:+ start:167 stop:442 length:276 start_codon:yes stop_codon:yes gene_type:complete